LVAFLAANIDACPALKRLAHNSSACRLPVLLLCRVAGSLKVCSRSLFFVPRDVHQPIFRVPFQDTSAVEG